MALEKVDILFNYISKPCCSYPEIRFSIFALRDQKCEPCALSKVGHGRCLFEIFKSCMLIS